MADLDPKARRVYWISTTPVPDTPLVPRRAPDDVRTYNEVAKQVMDEANVTVIDLYAFVTNVCGVDYTECPGFQIRGDVHFTEHGYTAMARYVRQVLNQTPVV